MAEFEIKTSQLKKNADSQNAIFSRMDALSGRIRAVSQKIHLDSASERMVHSNLNALAQTNENNAAKMKNLSVALNNIAESYEKTEQQIKGDGKPDIWNIIVKPVQSHFFYPVNPSGLMDRVISDAVTVMGTILGFHPSGTAEGELIGGSVKTKYKATWKMEKGDASVEAGVEAEGHLAKGKAKGTIGLLGGEAGVTIGTGAVSGKIGATLFKDGKFSPALDAKLKAEAAAAKGDVEGKIGNDTHNVHVKGSGTLLGAEAEASGSAGKITYKDVRTGVSKTEYGVKGKVGAEAYVAQGKASAGFTFFGIRVDAGISGKAGGAGASAEGRITTGGCYGKIGAGLGIGAGLEINIDWSNFSLW